MQVPGDQWPIFIYAHCEYKPEDMWKGAFRSAILVTVKLNQPSIFKQTAPQAYKHMFTSPSSVNKIFKAM